jgi:hypothetical protein
MVFFFLITDRSYGAKKRKNPSNLPGPITEKSSEIP